MALLTLHFWPEDVLRTPASPVTEFGPALQKTLEDMAETMYVERGIGLAAPQVGLSKRMIVIDVPSEDGTANLRALVNPVIVSREGTIVWEEGCLSFPGLVADVTRANKVRVRFQDSAGTERELDAEGLEAVCLQHECDHLDGITFVEYLSPLKRKLLLRDLKKNLAEREVAA